MTEEDKEIFAIKKPRLADQSIVVVDEVMENPNYEKLTEAKMEKIDIALIHLFFRTSILFRVAE